MDQPRNHHTPGPWWVRPAESGDDERYDVVGRGPYGLITLAEALDIDDARLVAAAPDLLEALRVVAEEARVANKGGPDVVDGRAVANAYAAIARAEGRS